MPENITKFFASIGMPLEHFPEEEDMREIWQFDGDLNGIVVQIYLSTNGRGAPSTFGELSFPDRSGLNLTFALSEWTNEADPYSPQMWIKKNLSL